MRTETGTADTTRPAEAEGKPPPKAAKSLDGRKQTNRAVKNGRKFSDRKTTAGKSRKTALPKIRSTTLRTDFHLNLATFAKMTGVTPTSLAKWERDQAVALSDEALGRVARVAAILEGLARVMRRAFIATWIEQPNDACKEIGAKRPLDLFEKGDYDTLEEMVWYLESGTPG